MHGVLVIDKPKGPTSFDVVRQVRRALGVKKAGHTGTLDPMATGVLPVCVGEATRIAQFLSDGDKEYSATLRLGQETDTLDAEGTVTRVSVVPPVDAQVLERALASFRGTFLQTPPMYSAVKKDGKRLYELAREGEEVDRAPRTVTVTRLELLDYSARELQVTVRATKGFYVRVLAQDVGRALGCGAHLVALRRTASGPFTLAQAVPLADVVEAGGAMAARLVSESEALTQLPSLLVSAAEAERVRHGGLVETSQPPGIVRVLGPGGELLAVAESAHGRLRYRRVLASHDG
jgi:tRNA pseudouridine55 synthase